MRNCRKVSFQKNVREARDVCNMKKVSSVGEEAAKEGMLSRPEGTQFLGDNNAALRDTVQYLRKFAT